MEGTYLLSMRCPVYRGRDSNLGFRTELENLVGDDKGNGTSGSPARPKVPRRRPSSDCSIVVKKRGNSRGAKGAGNLCRDRKGSTGKPEELDDVGRRRQPSMDCTSRVTGDSHARICESLGAKFPGATRRCEDGSMVSTIEAPTDERVGNG